MPNTNNWHHSDSSFCSECGTPTQIEVLLKGEASPAEQAQWQQHLQTSPSCEQAFLEDAKLQRVFTDYQADPFFEWMNNGWQPDFAKLTRSLANSPKLAATYIAALTKGDVQIMPNNFEMKDDKSQAFTPKAEEKDTAIEELPPVSEDPHDATPTQISSGFKRLLVLAASLVIVLIAAVLILAITSQKSGDTSLPNLPLASTLQPTTTSLTGNLDLSYPGGTKLKVDPDALAKSYPSGSQNLSFGAYATTDSDQQVITYYKQFLTKAGYSLPNATSTVQGTSFLLANTNNEVIDISATPSAIWQNANGRGAVPLSQFVSQLKPGQTLIYFTYGPMSSFEPPSPTPLPTPTPVSANSVAYLGPDNRFHIDNGQGLVSYDKSAPVSVVFTTTNLAQPSQQSVQLTVTNQISATVGIRAGSSSSNAAPASGISVQGHNVITVVIPGDTPAVPLKDLGSPGQTATPASSYGSGSNSEVVSGTGKAQLDWLISDQSGFIMSVSLSGLDNPMEILPSQSSDYGTLTDDAGNSYKLKGSIGGFDSGTIHWTLQGSSLPANIRKVTFTPGSALPFQLSSPFWAALENFQTAKLPQAVPFPNAVLQADGVKLSIPYGYFGTDRTVLAFNVDTSQLQSSYLAKGVNPFITPLIPSDGTFDGFSITDDHGKILKSLPANSAQSSFNASNPYQSQTITLSPVSVGTKNIVLKLDSYMIELNRTSPDSSSSPQSSFTVPVGNLIKSGTMQTVDQTTTLGGNQVEIVGEQATFDQNSQQASMTLKYLPHPASANSDITESQFVCVACTQVDGSSGYQMNDSSQAKESKLTFHYDPSKPDMEFQISEMSVQQKGNWQLTLSVYNGGH